MNMNSAKFLLLCKVMYSTWTSLHVFKLHNAAIT